MFFEEFLHINYNLRPSCHTLGWCDIPTFLSGGYPLSPSLATHPKIPRRTPKHSLGNHAWVIYRLISSQTLFGTVCKLTIIRQLARRCSFTYITKIFLIFCWDQVRLDCVLYLNSFVLSVSVRTTVAMVSSIWCSHCWIQQTRDQERHVTFLRRYIIFWHVTFVRRYIIFWGNVCLIALPIMVPFRDD
jgi:hypothetical protein